MLDVHPPEHAAHTWRDFLIHIATIVVGLLIAIGLEQTVELIHHRIELRELHGRLHDESESNRQDLTEFVSIFHAQAKQLSTNLTVLEYLQAHPGTRLADLPGAVSWSSGYRPLSTAVMEEALASSITPLIPQQELDELHDALHVANQINTDTMALFNKTAETSAYEFSSSDITRLTPQQLAEVIHGTELSMNQLYELGLWIAADCSHTQTSPCLTRDEVLAFHKPHL